MTTYTTAPDTVGVGPAGPRDSFRARASAAWRVWREQRLLPISLVVVTLGAWAFVMLVVFSHPMSRTSLGAVVEPARQGQVGRWTVVEHRDEARSLVPAFAPPISRQWKAVPTPPTPAPGGTRRYLAWSDDAGTHLALLGGDDVTVHEGGEGSEVSYRTGSATGHADVTLPATHRTNDLSRMTGASLLGPTWLMPSLTLVLAILLLWRTPRHRTRWAWFWLLNLPLGVGFVWMILREQCFLGACAPARDTRPRGWTGLVGLVVLSVPLGLLLEGVVPNP